MTRFEAIKQLCECLESDDSECAHIDADEVLCRLLESLGYEEIVELYYKIGKWYA